VLDVLINHRRFTACSGGDVFKVFLIEIPNQLEENHRQHPLQGQDVDITEPIGRKMFTNRMKSLRKLELIRATVTRESGRGEGYVLTDHGQNMFEGWPPLSDIPGLELDGPVRPDRQSPPRS
jgi:DNA-binding HxlR family transcriptional regulator